MLIDAKLHTPRRSVISRLRQLKIIYCLLVTIISFYGGMNSLPVAAAQEVLYLKGNARLDVPIVEAEVIVKCAAQNKEILTKTNRAGKFVIKARNVTRPCMLQVRGGYVDGAENTLKLHGFAYKSGTVNVTPVTDLSLAYAFAGQPDTVFDKSSPAPAFSQQAVEQGATYVKQQLELNHLGQLSGDVFHTPFRDKSETHQTISNLMGKVALSQRPWKSFVTWTSRKAHWHQALTPPPSRWRWNLPSTLPEPVVPASNPMSEAKVELGRYLFYDIRLSGNKKFSCATCHLQDKAFTDGKALAVGSTGQKHPRSSPSLGNAAYNARLTWANPLEQHLEEQINAPMFGMHPVEMGVNDKNRQEVIGRIQVDGFYQAQFKRAFPGQDNVIRWENIKKAISTFQRTLLTGNSRYDRHIRGEKGVEWSAAEENGYALFFTSAKCFACHGSFNFNDTDTYKNGPPPDIRFHNTGLFNIGGTGAFPKRNRGVFEFTKKTSDMGKFRAPTLRNIAVTAPYMHDGSIPTLEKVLDFYAEHGRNIKHGTHAGDGRRNPYKSKDVDEIHLTEKEKADIVAFLKTLTDQEFLANPQLSNPFEKAP